MTAATTWVPPRQRAASVGPGHAEWGGLCATHEHYRLRCENFEALWSRANGSCEICSTPSGRSTHGMLHLDHDCKIGQWAVRGLLCGRCNSIFERHQGKLAEFQDAIDSFLANPWHAVMLARAGVGLDMPEPAAGVDVEMPYGRRWRRNDRGWFLLTSAGTISGHPRSWQWLRYRYGPHNIQVIERTSTGPDPLADAAQAFAELRAAEQVALEAVATAMKRRAEAGDTVSATRAVLVDQISQAACAGAPLRDIVARIDGVYTDQTVRKIVVAAGIKLGRE